jgi:hypothetical protein
MRWEEEELENKQWWGLLHDLGKENSKLGLEVTVLMSIMYEQDRILRSLSIPPFQSITSDRLDELKDELERIRLNG